MKDQRSTGIWTNVWIFSLIALINVSVFMSIPCCFYCCSSVVQCGGDTSSNAFIIQECFSYSGFFMFPNEADRCPFNFCKELCWSFDGNCVESYLSISMRGLPSFDIFFNFFNILKFLLCLSLSWLELPQDIF